MGQLHSRIGSQLFRQCGGLFSLPGPQVAIEQGRAHPAKVGVFFRGPIAFIEQWQGFGEATRVLLVYAQVRQGQKRVRVLPAEFRLPMLERLLEDRNRLVELLCLPIGGSQFVHALERVGMVGTELGFSGL